MRIGFTLKSKSRNLDPLLRDANSWSHGRYTYGIAEDPGGVVSSGLVGGSGLLSPGLTVIPRGFNGIKLPVDGSKGVRSAGGSVKSGSLSSVGSPRHSA